MLALGPWAWGLRCRRPHRSGIAGPHPMKHDAQPHQRDQHQLIEKEMGDHGKTPSYRWSNEGILPGFRRWELAAGWRYTTGQHCANHPGGNWPGYEEVAQ